jgi:hypothetical protein
MEFVKDERKRMVAAANKILDFLEGEAIFSEDNPNQLQINKMLLEVSAHLANIGGLCDHRTQDQIARIQGVMMLGMQGSFGNIIIKGALPIIVGIQVDFTKRPFKAVKFELGASLKQLGAHFKAGANR